MGKKKKAKSRAEQFSTAMTPEEARALSKAFDRPSRKLPPRGFSADYVIVDECQVDESGGVEAPSAPYFDALRKAIREQVGKREVPYEGSQMQRILNERSETVELDAVDASPPHGPGVDGCAACQANGRYVIDLSPPPVPPRDAENVPPPLGYLTDAQVDAAMVHGPAAVTSLPYLGVKHLGPYVPTALRTEANVKAAVEYINKQYGVKAVNAELPPKGYATAGQNGKGSALSADEIGKLLEGGAKGYTTKDSGVRESFDSGMVRDTQAGKPRFDLVMPLAVPYARQCLTRWAALMGRGAEKYGDRNWEKADSVDELNRAKASALRHFMQWYHGEVDEDHLAATWFNMQEVDYVEGRIE